MYMRGEGLPKDVPVSHRTCLKRWEDTGIISPRAMKVRAFRDALVGDDLAVVLDTHMNRLLFGKDRINQTEYAAGTKRITNLALRLGWKPAATQAALWAGWLRETGRNVPVMSGDMT